MVFILLGLMCSLIYINIINMDKVPKLKDPIYLKNSSHPWLTFLIKDYYNPIDLKQKKM